MRKETRWTESSCERMARRQLGHSEGRGVGVRVRSVGDEDGDGDGEVRNRIGISVLEFDLTSHFCFALRPQTRLIS